MGRLHPLATIARTADTPAARPAPKGWEPGIYYRHGIPDTITTPPAPEANDPDAWSEMIGSFGWPLPDGARLELVEARYDPAAWTRATADQDKATTAAVWRYRFRVITDPATITRADLDALAKIAAKGKPRKTPPAPKTDSAYVVTLADFQIGKGHDGPDADQGLDETVQRALDALERIATDIRKVKPTEIVILDAGDGIENCMNVPTQARTNDLDLTDQVRVWSRLVMRYVTRLAGLAPRLTVAAVPSNHGEVRTGPKTPMSGPHDDWGLLAMTTVQDAVALATPDAPITWAYPRRGQDTLTIPAAGTNLGLAHGHRAPSADKVPDWISKQAAGRQPLEAADVIVTGHFHHLRVQQILGGRFWLQAPAADAGSQWYTRVSGEWSAPGILTFQTANRAVWGIKVH